MSDNDSDRVEPYDEKDIKADPLEEHAKTDEELEQAKSEIEATIAKEQQAAAELGIETSSDDSAREDVAPETVAAEPAPRVDTGPGEPSAMTPPAASAPVAHGDAQQRVNNAFLLEVVGGFFGLLGLGYLYAGDQQAGLIRLVGWWIVLFIMWSTVSLLTAILIGLCLIPVALIVQLLVPIWSASSLKARMQAEIM